MALLATAEHGIARPRRHEPPVFPHQEVPLASSNRYPIDRTFVATNIMSERFSETLRTASEPGWAHAVGHRFVKELLA